MFVNSVSSIADPEDIKRAISEAVKKQLTHAELAEQKVSFVIASVSDKSGITKEQIRQFVAAR